MKIALLCCLVCMNAGAIVKRESEPLLLSTFDWNEDGILDRRELKIISRIFSAMAVKSPRRVRQMLWAADADHNRSLDEEEFNTFIDSVFPQE